MSDSQERWLPIDGFDGYEISDMGRVRSRRGLRGRKEEPRILKLSKDKDGYAHITMSRTGQRIATRKVHRLVLEAFVGPCPAGMECRHVPDNDPQNNALSNLTWGTRLQNAADRLSCDTQARGERHGGVVLTDALVSRIKRSTDSATVTARAVGVGRGTIRAIKEGRTWRHVQPASDELGLVELLRLVTK